MRGSWDGSWTPTPPGPAGHRRWRPASRSISAASPVGSRRPDVVSSPSPRRRWPFPGATLAGQRLVIQGFGNVGRHVAQIAAEQGAVIVGVSDVSGGRHVAEGFDVPALLAAPQPGALLKEVGIGDFVTNAELLALDCDVLIPAALENAIDATNVATVRAPLVVEAANHPVSPEADAVLAEGGVIVVPDILANAGGVTGSYFEWTSNLTEFRWSEERFNEQLLAFMDRASERRGRHTRTRGRSADCGVHGRDRPGGRGHPAAGPRLRIIDGSGPRTASVPGSARPRSCPVSAATCPPRAGSPNPRGRPSPLSRPLLREPFRKAAPADGTPPLDGQSDQYLPLVDHGLAVLVPIGMLATDGAKIGDETFHRRRKVDHNALPATWTHSPPNASDSTQSAAWSCNRKLRTLARSG